MTERSAEELDRLRKLRLFAGAAPAFWAQFTEIALELTGAVQARSLVQLQGRWSLLATAPGSGSSQRSFLQTNFDERAGRALESTAGLRVEGEREDGTVHLLHPLQTEDASAPCLIELRFGADKKALHEADFWQRVLPLLADTPRLYQKNLAAIHLRQDVERMREALDLLAVVNSQRAFAPATMALVNEVSSRLQAERACLGWVKAPYVRVVAVSGTEKFERKMQILQELEAAMEECRDQDEELTWPAPPDSTAVYRDHEMYANRSGSGCLLSVPIRDDGAVVGVLTVERRNPPFTETDGWGLRVLADQIAPRLHDLRHRSRWFPVRWATAARRGLAKVLSPKHTWLKFWAIVISAVLLFSLLVPFAYRVSATFIVRPDSLAHMPAPYDGFIATAGVRPGDVVEAGQALVSLDDRELSIERAETAAEIRRFHSQAEQAETEGALAELRVARAQRAQAEARLDLLDHRLKRSVIRSPFDGVVVQGELRERIGAPVSQGEVLLQVSELDGLYVEIKLSERDIDLLGDSRSGAVVFASRPDVQFPIRITKVSPAARADQDGNAFNIRAELEADAEWLRPGMSGVARIDAGKRTLAWRATHRIIDFIRMRLWF
ncbi:MAG: HlyD family efflux transporter periplasmic adaptor subunit [Verrucomicrobia bacterium]|nr:HlyD family efflux transporter periplasmic adaptor subunit [Verrucomicrobiota bacterium]